MLVSLFIIGTFWFWLLLAAECLFLFWVAENNKPGTAVFSLIIVFACLAVFGNFNILHWIAQNPWWYTAGSIAGYFIVGTAWSFGKWWFFVKNRYRKYVERKAQLKDEATDYELNYLEKDFGKPTVSNYKSNIMTWMTYWPWSMAWTIINDPVKKIFQEIFERIKNYYTRIADSIYQE